MALSRPGTRSSVLRNNSQQHAYYNTVHRQTLPPIQNTNSNLEEAPASPSNNSVSVRAILPRSNEIKRQSSSAAQLVLNDVKSPLPLHPRPLSQSQSPVPKLNQNPEIQKSGLLVTIKEELHAKTPSPVPKEIKIGNDKFSIVRGTNYVPIDFKRATQQTRTNGSANDPIVDFDVPCVLHFTSMKNIFHSTFETNLPPLPDVGSPDFDELFVKKIAICSLVLDFSSPQAQLREKEAKGRILCEFIQLFENSRDVKKLNIEQQQMTFAMLEKNIFRQEILPSKDLTIDYTTTVIEPSWPHLFYCYQILNRFAQVFSDSSCITPKIIRRALLLTQLPDPNERMQLVAFMRTIYDTRIDLREQILNWIFNDLQEIIQGINSPLSAMPLLVILSHSFLRATPPYGPFALRLLNHILPLIRLPYLNLFFQNIKQLISNIAKNAPEHSKHILYQIDLLWPTQNGYKQQALLELILVILSKMKQEELAPIASNLFSFFANCANSPHAHVSETAIEIWNKCANEPWLVQNSRLGISKMFEPIWNASEKAWFLPNREKAQSALSQMCKLHKSQYHKMKTAQRAGQIKRTITIHSSPAVRSWCIVAKKASLTFEPYDYHAKIKSIKDLFANNREEFSRTTHFMANHNEEDSTSGNS